jgi:hypothetical protein
MISQTYHTNDLALAAALAAMGIPFASLPFVHSKSAKGGDSYLFFFKDVSECGKYRTGELSKAWNDAEWHTKNPEHPFSYVLCAFKNREALLDKVKQSAPLVVIEKAGKMAIVSANASPELQTAIFSKL